MSLEFKSKEDFFKEITIYQELNDTSLLEAIVEYQKKYDLDQDYIVSNLMSPPIFERLEAEAKTFNLIKKEDNPKWNLTI